MNKLLDTLNAVFQTDDSGAAKLLGVDKSTISRYRTKGGMTHAVACHAEALIRLSKKEQNTIRKERIG